MKRFLLFAGESYYATGGWGDFCGDFDSVEEAEAEKLKLQIFWDWYHIVDAEIGLVIISDQGTYSGQVNVGQGKEDKQK